jgi:hypothetical protein
VWAATNGVLGTTDQMVLHQPLGTEGGQTIVDQNARPISVN